MTAWYDEDMGIDFVLWRDESREQWFLSCNGQGNLPVTDVEAQRAIAEHGEQEV